jgi:hypothetical protein
MLKPNLIAIALLFLFLPRAGAQTYLNAAYAEVGGQGILFSLNYDVRLNHTVAGPGLRVGLGYGVSTDPSYFSVPVGVNWLFGNYRGHYLELGAGMTYVSISNVAPGDSISFANKEWHGDQRLFLATTVIGYRYQPEVSHFHFRAGFSPQFGKAVWMIPYLSVGYAF